LRRFFCSFLIQIDFYKFILSEGAKGWTKEINIVSWNDRKPKIDIREWDETHEKMSKGVTLSKKECILLKELFQGLDIEALDID
jgi:hypothetical protein